MDKLLTAVAHPLAPGPNPLHAAAHYAALPLHFAHSLCPCTLWPFFLLKYISIILFLRHKPEFLPLHLKPQRGKPQVSSGEAWESPIHSPRSPPGPFLLTFLFPFTIPLPFILVLLHSGPMSSPKTFQPSTASALHFYSAIAAPFTSPTRNQSPQSPATLLYPALPPPHLLPWGLPLAASLTLMLSSHLLRGSLWRGTSGEGLRGSPAFIRLMEGSTAGLPTCPLR